MKFEKEVTEFEERKNHALGMGNPRELENRSSKGVMNARERIDYLLDPDSFLESGLFATSVNPDDKHKTPADGKIAGFGKINNRDIGIVSNDFSVKGASSSQTNTKKMEHIKQVSKTRGFPVVFLGESTGARMPDVMGARNIIGVNNSPTQYLRLRETPWAAAALGYCFGSSAWYTVMSDFAVMRKGAYMAVSSPRLVSLATKQEVDWEELAGWKMHTDITGLIDLAVDTDEEALETIKKYLSYLPSHQNEKPPRYSVPVGSDEAVKNIVDLIPESKNQVYDVRKIIKAIVDKDSYFELKARFGKSLVTTFARIDGNSVGIIANNPLYKGGAIDADCCDKAMSFLVQCDSFNIPLIFFTDQPGFLIGLEAEKKRIPGKVMNWLNALALCSVPKISMILRKSYGLAVRNMGGSHNADEVAAWWTAEVSFMDPRAAVSIIHGVSQEEDPERYSILLKEMSRDTTAYDVASVYGAQAVIDPRESRDYLKRMLEIHELRMTNGVGKHLLQNWPTSF